MYGLYGATYVRAIFRINLCIGPDWASVNLGLFMCIRCSGIHRSLGTHISFVRSTVIDDWKQEQIDTMCRVGNAKARAYWEARGPGKRYSEYDNIE